MIADIEDDIMDPVMHFRSRHNPSYPFEFHLKETCPHLVHGDKHEMLLSPPLRDHLKMEILSSSNVKLITECSDTTYTCYEVMKDLIKVSKLPLVLVGDAVVLKDPEQLDKYLVRRLVAIYSAIEG
ncbi:hypothetical protein Tco_0527402 [Tanacetum coccineum]